MIELDHDVDALYHQIFRELLVFMIENPRTIRQSTQLLFVARHLERMADYCTNLGEAVLLYGQGRAQGSQYIGAHREPGAGMRKPANMIS